MPASSSCLSTNSSVSELLSLSALTSKTATVSKSRVNAMFNSDFRYVRSVQ